jgi:hypothetical protein
LMISNFSYRELENQAGKLNQINENHWRWNEIKTK